MKTVKFKRNSWHWHIADLGGFGKRKNDTLCEYVFSFLQGVTILTLLGSYLLGFLIVCVSGAYNVVHCRLGTRCPISQSDWGPLLFVAVVAALLALVALILWFGGRRGDKAPGGESLELGFLCLAWRTIKDRTCRRIEFIDQE